MDFLIFAPPRSRTAWLANFLTYENSYCYHEALAMVTKVEDLMKLKRDEKITGNSDSGLFLFAEKVLKLLPDAKVVLVKRDKEGIHKSLMELFDPILSEHVADICVSVSEWLETVRGVLTVNFDDLNEEAVCWEIWKFCNPNAPFDSERWKMLSNFNIQLHKIEFDYNQVHTLLTNEERG